MVLHLNEDAVVRDRIYVSSRTSKPKNGMLANEEESIYGHSPCGITTRNESVIMTHPGPPAVIGHCTVGETIWAIIWTFRRCPDTGVG